MNPPNQSLEQATLGLAEQYEQVAQGLRHAYQQLATSREPSAWRPDPYDFRVPLPPPGSYYQEPLRRPDPFAEGFASWPLRTMGGGLRPRGGGLPPLPPPMPLHLEHGNATRPWMQGYNATMPPAPAMTGGATTGASRPRRRSGRPRNHRGTPSHQRRRLLRDPSQQQQTEELAPPAAKSARVHENASRKNPVVPEEDTRPSRTGRHRRRGRRQRQERQPVEGPATEE